MEQEHRKEIRREKRIAARVTEELFEAASERAYEEHKTLSTLVVEALMKYLNFKMPPKGMQKSADNTEIK
jgi:predicted HicB family RNase H-like nuclease